MVVEIRLGDVVRLRKPHPCGGYEWEVIRVGADIRIRCLVCDRQVMMPRSALEKRTKAFVTGPSRPLPTLLGPAGQNSARDRPGV